MAETTIWHGTGTDDDLRLVRRHDAETPQDDVLLLRQAEGTENWEVSMIEPTAVRALGQELIAWADAKQAALAPPLIGRARPRRGRPSTRPMPSPPTREERWRPVLALMDAVRRTSEPPELEQARDLLAGTGGEVDPVVALVALRYCTEIQHVPMPDEVGPIIEGGGA